MALVQLYLPQAEARKKDEADGEWSDEGGTLPAMDSRA